VPVEGVPATSLPAFQSSFGDDDAVHVAAGKVTLIAAADVREGYAA
jgi:hypothetical protein